MEVVTIENANDYLGEGDNPDTKGIMILRGLYETSEQEVLQFWSKWNLSKTELELINENKCVYLGTMGMAHPPMMMMVVHPENLPNFDAFTVEEVRHLHETLAAELQRRNKDT